MRILLTADPELPVPPPLYGGIERIIDWLARGLMALGHEVGLVGHRDSLVEGARLYAWPGASSRSALDTALNVVHLQRAVRSFGPDLIHSFSRLVYLLPFARSRTPRIMSFQRRPTARTVRWSSRIAGRNLVYTGCSHWIAAEGRRHGGEWYPIHNGVEVHRYDFQPSVPLNAPLVFLSRMDRVKAPHLAIKIAKRAGRRLILAGNCAERGPDRDYFDRVVQPLVDGTDVRWIGPVNDAQKNELLGAAVALLVPIQWDEPFGIVFAEAMACGTPVLATPRGALPEIVRSGVDGFLSEDPDELATAAETAHDFDRTMCRRRVEERFSSKVIVQQYSDLYTQIIQQAGPR
jgi:glycosyltransferase involved in cell wall biosynthesis